MERVHGDTKKFSGFKVDSGHELHESMETQRFQVRRWIRVMNYIFRLGSLSKS